MHRAHPTLEKLAARGIGKTYGDAVALDGIDLTVAAGEFLTLLGPSGSGKTTLLQIIAGLVQPTAGRILIDGRDCTLVPAHLRDIGVIFQSYALFPHMSVGENIAFPLEMRRLSAAAIKTKVDTALDLVGLAGLAHRLPAELSGGQQQRVALARCIVYEPALILMDEPLAALDRKLREAMQIEIKRLHRDTGATIIFVTHDQEEALALSDRVCLMNKARIAQIGTPQDIYERPASAFVADFVGISNLLHGRIAPDGRLVTPHGYLTAPPSSFGPGDEASLMIRPEHIALGAEAGAAVTGQVAEIVYTGVETRVLVKLDTGALLTVRQIRDKRPQQMGERVGLHWHPEDTQLLPD
jgi:putative spermidine/putrescine transport system ATP-binding protein